jgi:phage baseplate assembly protein V
MSDDFMSMLADERSDEDQKIYGVALAQVVDNIDLDGRGRVQVELPWMPDVKPWARVVSPSAGSKRGVFFMPQPKEEVLVAFNHGDVTDAFVLGGVWNSQDKPPATSTQDPVDKRVIHTPQGHKVELDDTKETITITSISEHVVTITPNKIELALAESKATLTLASSGDVTLEATGTLKLKGRQVNVEASTGDVKCDASLSIDGGQQCSLSASLVRINCPLHDRRPPRCRPPPESETRQATPEPFPARASPRS